MKLLTIDHESRMRADAEANANRIAHDQEPEGFEPVVKLFCPWNGATWLLTELDVDDPDIAFGLCDLGMGFPEIGSVRLSELAAVRGPGGLRIERVFTSSPQRPCKATPKRRSANRESSINRAVPTTNAHKENDHDRQDPTNPRNRSHAVHSAQPAQEVTAQRPKDAASTGGY
jgi:hypothetical protein